LKYISEFRSSELAQGLISDIRGKSKQKVRLMEFCGGHTVAIFKYGIRQALPAILNWFPDRAVPSALPQPPISIKQSRWRWFPALLSLLFGDMLRVPGSRASLQQARAAGADVRIVYSTLDALKIAQENPSKTVVFIGSGLKRRRPPLPPQCSRQRNKKSKITGFCPCTNSARR